MLADSELIEDSRFEGETQALLDLIGNQSPAAEEEAAADDDEEPEPALTGETDASVDIAELCLPLSWGPCPARVYTPPGHRTRPLVLWLHGGSFIGGSARDLDAACSGIAGAAGVTVVSLEYRLAPTHRFPAAVHDTYEAMGWLVRHGAALGGNGVVAAGGQSAGGCLVAAACLMTRDRGEPTVARQVLCYPVLDFRQQTESARRYEGVFLTADAVSEMEQHYLGGQQVTPYAAPLRAEKLSALPPALVIGAGRDPLRDDARSYAARLRADGVPARHVEYAATMHAFLNFCGALSAGKHAVSLIADDLRIALDYSPPCR